MTVRHLARISERPEQRDLGSTVETTADANATRIYLLEASEFEEKDNGGGTLRVRLSADGGQDLVLAYTGWDDEEDTGREYVDLVTALPAAVPAGTRVDVWDVASASPDVVYEGRATLDDAPADSTPRDFTVSQALIDQLGPTGLPGTDASVTLEREDRGDEWTLVEVHGLRPVVDLSYVDVDTAPDGLGGDTGPTEPPTSSPAVIVSGLPDGLVLQLADTPEAGARVQYHVSTDQTAGMDFVPSAATTAGPETVAGVSVVDRLPDGTAFVEGVTYYARAVALNDLGAAPAGPGASGQLNRNGIRLLVTAALVAGFILTGRIQIGQAYIDANEGFVIPNPPQSDGTVTYSRLPFNGDPISLVAELIATTLTVQGIATFLQLVRVLRRVELGDGISAPTEAPAVVSAWPAVALPAGPAAAGLAQDPASPSTRWLTARPVTLSSGAPGVEVVSVLRAGGGAATRVASTEAIVEPAGLVVAGGRYWLLGRTSNALVWALVGISTSSATDVVVRRLSFTFQGREYADPVINFRPAFGVNSTGGSLILAYAREGDGGGYELETRTFAAGSGAVGTTSTLQQAINDSQRNLAWVGQGDYNFGASRIVVQAVDNPAMVWSGTLSNPTRIFEASFPRALGGSIAGMVWDGTRFRSLVAGQPGQIAAHAATRVAAEQVTIGNAWAGQSAANGGGSTIETNLGPTRTATIAAQAQIGVTVATPPEADLADPAVANRAAVYALTGGTPGTQRRQALLPIGSRATTFDAITATGRAAGATGAFASAPGDLVPFRGAAEADKGFIFKGSGYGRLGDLERRADGAMVAGPLVAAAVRQDTGWQTLPLRSGYQSVSGLTVQYKRKNGLLMMRGAVQRTSGTMAVGSNHPVGDLPVGFIPDISGRYVVGTLTTGPRANLDVSSGGVVTVYIPSDGTAAVSFVYVAPPPIDLPAA